MVWLLITCKIHYYLSSTYTCFDLGFIDFCNVMLVLCVYFRYLLINGPCASKWWKKEESSQSPESQQIRWESQRQAWRPSRPMTGKLSPHVTPVMVFSWKSLPKFSNSFPIFLHLLHYKGHDQRHLSWSFCLINRPGTISIHTKLFREKTSYLEIV